MTTIVFWQEALSIHRAPLIREISQQPGMQVRAVSFDDVSSARQAMGWAAPDYGSANVEIFEPQDWHQAAMAHEDADVHVFAGFGAWAGLREVQRYLTSQSAAQMFVLTEPWDDRGVKGFLRLVRARQRVRRLGARMTGVLPCGRRARTQLRKFGALKSVPLYDFGYFVDASDAVIPETHPTVRLIFVGALAEWKAPLLLVRALANLQDFDWQLSMYGKGEQASAVAHEIRLHGLDSRIHLHDFQPHQVIREAIATSDFLVLPSQHDGWGAVINEALMDGTRVVVSDAAGASDLVKHALLGVRFHTADRADLERALREAFAMPRDQTTRTAIRTWAERNISPRAAAEYFSTILRNTPDTVPPPWHRPPAVLDEERST